MSRVLELEALIIKHKALYYQGHPEISDIEFDSLEAELKKLDPNNYSLSIVGSTKSNIVVAEQQLASITVSEYIPLPERVVAAFTSPLLHS